MEKILITGGAGYIGSLLATQLVKIGHKVTVVDLLKYNKNSLKHLYHHKNFKLIKKDVRNFNFIRKLVRQNEFIIPLAALVGAPLCEKNKSEAIKTNFESIKFLVKILTKKNKLIFLTSNSGYGVGKKNRFCDENSPLNPLSLYGKTKCDAEKEVLKLQNVVAFRLATVFGSSFRMRSDLLVNNLTETAIKKGKLNIFEPHFRRNYIHIKDVVKAILYSIKNFGKLKANVYNLGLSSANLTKIQLAKKIKKSVKKLKIKISKNKKDPDQRDYFVSNKKIEKKGFKANISLESGIDEMSEVFKNNKKNIVNNY
tara:strand:+ start:467 stop:1402 length:936 start_codon:yes stop_codon:yes gene_type:complete